jgi:aspergillopepsin I
MRMILMDGWMTDMENRWVFSSETPSSQRASHNIYDPSKSSTAQEMPKYTWSITYRDGSSSSGNVYEDIVNVGGTIVSGQAVELAEQVSAEFVDGEADGVLGLSYLTLNTSMSGLTFAWS